MILNWTEICQILHSTATWWQLGLFSAALGSGFFLAWIVSALVKSKFAGPELSFAKSKVVHVTIFNGFIFAALLAVIGISETIVGSNSVILFLTQCAFFGMITTYIWIFTNNWLIPTGILAIAIIVKVLRHLSLFNTAAAFLDKYSISVGTFTLTPLGFIKIVLSVLFLIWLATNLAKYLQAQIGRMTHIKAPTRELLKKVVSFGVYAVALLFSLKLAGIQLTALAVLGGGLGVGIGLGLQKISANFVSGVIILVEGNFKKGDLIEIEGGPGGANTGTIKQFGSRYTLLESGEGREVLIPNEEFVTHRVTNWTLSNPRAQITIPVEITYQSDVPLAQRLMVEAASAHAQTLENPAPACLLVQFADRGIRLQLQFNIKDITAGRPQIQSEVMARILEKFKENKIEICSWPKGTVG